MSPRSDEPRPPCVPPSPRPRGRWLALAASCAARAAASALDALAPSTCADCRADLAGDRPGFCPGCRERLAALRRLAPAPAVGRALLVAAPYEYEGRVRELVHRLKFGREARIGRALGRDLARYLGPSLPVRAIVPVPSDWRRFQHRGFHAAEEIARGVAGELGRPLRRLLRRRCGAAPQSRLAARDRRSGPDRVYRVRRRAAIEGPVLLVDDVATTGSTLRTCARALHRAGAGEVLAAVVAISAGGGLSRRSSR